ncbi:MAG TPA: DUF2189 domain-containing protein [Chromatiales bacterium]|nr:DUF2189 domain-containing protein [Chromatiales bacterium]
METTRPGEEKKPDAAELPFVAPCRRLEPRAPLRWLSRGWQDFRRTPRQSLGYGLVMVLLSYLISFLALEFGNLFFLLGLISGFVFMGPVIAIGLYSISCQLQRGMTPRLGYCLREGKRHLGNEMIFAFILVIVLLIWARAASMVHVFFPVHTDPSLEELVIYLGIGTAVGAIFSAIIFCISAFSLPMIMDRKADMVTAVITSVNAVLRNKLTMFLWAGIIGFTVLVGLMTAFLGFAVLLPVLGYATWHAYQDTIDASAWPMQD